MWPFNKKARNPGRTWNWSWRSGWDAAKSSNLLNDIRGSNRSINQDARMDLQTLRNRCRELEKNNGHARQFLRLIEANVIGSEGIVLQSQATSRAGQPDQDLRDAIELQFRDWGKKKNASVNWEDSWIQIQRLAVRTVALAGEVLIRKILDANSPWGIRLQVLDPDFLPIQKNMRAPNGNRIQMGIELDTFGRPLNYYLATDHPGDNVIVIAGGRYVPVPAAEVIHLFYKERPGQIRGIPWMASAIIDAHHLDKFLEATVVKQRVEASKMGFITQDIEGGQPYEGQDTASDGKIVSEVMAGIIELLPPGTDFKQFDPTSTENLEIFVKTIIRRFSVGVGVSYHALSGDLEDVNYSSIRAGVLETQDFYKGLQRWAIENLSDPVWDWWIPMALLGGQLPGLGMADFDRVNRALWQGRRWAWVDPEKELKAKKLEIGLGLSSRPGIIREMGKDPATVTEEIEADTFIPPAEEAATEPNQPAEEQENEGDQNDGSEENETDAA